MEEFFVTFLELFSAPIILLFVVTLPIRFLEIDIHLQWLILVAISWPLLKLLWNSHNGIKWPGLSIVAFIALCTYVALGIEATPPFYDRNINTDLPNGFSVDGFDAVQRGMSREEAAELMGIHSHPREATYATVQRRAARADDEDGQWTVYTVRFDNEGLAYDTFTYERSYLSTDGKTYFSPTYSKEFSIVGFEQLTQGMHHSEVTQLIGRGYATGTEYYGKRGSQQWPGYGNMVYTVTFRNNVVTKTRTFMQVD